MKPNPFLKKLGLSNNDRAVIFHADDISMSQAALSAYIDLAHGDTVTSAALMVPCPWFPATATFLRENQDKLQLDVGVHLTLTSEWVHYRWGPISTGDPATGLLDNQGYFHAACAPLQEKADAASVQQELTSQIERALASGIDVTHIDSHMGAVFHPKFLSLYLQLAHQYNIPALMLRRDALEHHGDSSTADHGFGEVPWHSQEREEDDYPLLDSIELMPLDSAGNRLQVAIERLEQLPVGISYFIIHPAKNTPELRAYASDWACRVADYELFMDDRWLNAIDASGVKPIGWRALI
jgi:predicted glycoside hydrolase/deacetylase ChbG (UPF0249 family)